MNKWYPVHLDMSGRHCVVIGGGSIAVRRIRGLLDAGAKITVISPQCHPDIHILAADNNLHVVSRNYEGSADLTNADLICTATDDTVVNKWVTDDARKLRIPLNNLGDSKLSTFIVPAVLRRGQLIMSVSTSGASPGLTKQIQKELSVSYGIEYEEYVDFLAELREWVLVKVESEQCRSMIFHHVLQFDIMNVIKLDKLHALRSWLRSMLEQEHQVDEWEQLLKNYSNNI